MGEVPILVNMQYWKKISKSCRMEGGEVDFFPFICESLRLPFKIKFFF